jgi:hypothetical protein
VGRAGRGKGGGGETKDEEKSPERSSASPQVPDPWICFHDATKQDGGDTGEVTRAVRTLEGANRGKLGDCRSTLGVNYHTPSANYAVLATLNAACRNVECVPRNLGMSPGFF